jgi:hypothetical protein
MAQTIAIEKNITTLNQLQARFNLRRSDDDQFFTEWFNGLSQLTDSEKQALDGIKQQYFYQRADGPLAEGAVKMVVLAKLLDLAGFYNPPFRFRTETGVEIAIEDRDEILRGRIDALVIQEQFWVLVIESKRTTFSTDVALPQALAYMMANPNPERPIFGLVTNGSILSSLSWFNLESHSMTCRMSSLSTSVTTNSTRFCRFSSALDR